MFQPGADLYAALEAYDRALATAPVEAVRQERAVVAFVIDDLAQRTG